MDTATLLRDFAFSKYESACYLSLLAQHPTNGSQLSKLSGIARSRIYDVLRGLIKKGIVFEVAKGQYVPLPFEELKRRLRSQFESNLSVLEEKLAGMTSETPYAYLLTLKGYDVVLRKASEIIGAAHQELYLRLFPDAYKHLQRPLKRASERGVGIRLVAMGQIPVAYDIQVIHPNLDNIETKIGGRSLDIIADKREALVGIFETDNTDGSHIIWTRNQWFITANRDSLRHDFYHYFLDKLYERGEALTASEKRIYEFIKRDE